MVPGRLGEGAAREVAAAADGFGRLLHVGMWHTLGLVGYRVTMVLTVDQL